MPYANNNGIRIHYEVEGSGPPVLMQGGLGYSLESWYKLGYVDELKEDYQLILVDARGHGQSDKPDNIESYRPESIAGDYVGILDDLGIERACFWGFSMGAIFGFRCIARHARSRFSSLILGGGDPFGDRTEGEKEFTQKFITIFVGVAGKEAFPAMVQALSGVNAGDVLAEIKVPCLVYAGETDGSLPRIREAVKSMPKATFFTLPGVNHGQAWSRSELVLPHVKKFLAEIKAD